MRRFRLIGFAVVVGVAALSWVATCGAWQLSRVVAGVAPLDPRTFQRLGVVTAGTGGAYENPDRRGPATLVGLGDHVALVDAGRAVAESLRASEVPPSQPELVLLTNLLPENTVGLDDLLVSGWLAGRDQPLRLVGPAGTRALAQALESAHAAGLRARADELALPPAGASFAVEEISDAWSTRLGDLEVRAGALPGGPIEAFAYRFEAQGRSAVVSGTGWSPDALIAFARGADLLVHEAVFVPTPEIAQSAGIDVDPERLRREAALHTTIADVGELAQRAGVSTLVLVRLRPPPVYAIQITSLVNDRFDGSIVVASDGEALTP